MFYDKPRLKAIVWRTCIGRCLVRDSLLVKPTPPPKPNTVTRTPTTKNATEMTNNARPTVATSSQRRRRRLRLLPTHAQGSRDDAAPTAAPSSSALSMLDSVDRLETVRWWCSSWWIGNETKRMNKKRSWPLSRPLSLYDTVSEDVLKCLQWRQCVRCCQCYRGFRGVWQTESAGRSCTSFVSCCLITQDPVRSQSHDTFRSRQVGETGVGA